MASRGKRKGPYPYWQWISSGKRKKTKDYAANSLGESFQEDSNTESSKIVQWKEPRFEDGVQLSAQQQYVLDLIRQGKNVFYTGNAGTGKTTLLKEIRKCAPEGTFVTALTGVAAVQAGGTTLHSFAGIGLGNGTKESLCDIVRRGSKAKNWRKAKVLIIDELSMLDGRLFDKLEYIACEVRNCKLPFGGLQLVVCGDFFQLPPIQKVGETSINYCFQSKSWDKCIDYNIELTQIYRQSDPRLIKLLYEVRYQCLSDESLELLNHLNRPIPNCADIEPTKLYSHNARVNDINNAKLMCLPGQEMVYTAEDHGQAPYVDNMSKYVIAMDRLVLKIGAQVMLLKNLTEDLINGSRGVVEGFDNDGWPQVKFVDGQFKTIKQEEWNLENSSARVLAVRTQVPLKLAWAITIHKSQGMSIDFLQVDLKNVFSQGQAYVALSRARTLEGLQVLSFDVNKFTTSDAVIKFYQDKVKSAPTNQSNTAQDTSPHFFTPSYLSNSATSTPLKRKRSSKDNNEIGSAEKQSSKVSPSEERSLPSIHSQKRLDKRSRRSETNTTPSRDGKEKMSPNIKINHIFKHLDERSKNADSTTFSNTVTTPSHDRGQESAKLQSPSFPSLPSFSQSLRGFQNASHLYQSQNQPMGYQIIKEEGDSKHLQPVQRENHSVFHEKHKANDNQFVDDDILDSKSLKAVLSQNECLDDVQENVDISNDFNDFSFGDDDISDSECIRASQESLELFSEELPGSECLEESKTKSTNSNEKLIDLELAKCDSDQEEYRQESTTEQTPFTVKRKRHRPTTSTKTKEFELQQTTFTSMPLPSKTMLSDSSEKSEHCNKSRRESGKKYARLRERSKKKCSLLFEKLKDESVNSEADIISAGSKTSCVEDNISLNNKNATWYENTQGDIDCSKVSYGGNTYKGSSLSNSSKCSESNQEDKSLRRKKSKRKTSDKASTVQSTEPLDIKRSQERSKERCGQLFDSLKDESNTCTPESSVIEDTPGKINSKSRKSQSLTSTTPCAPRAKRKSKNSDEINSSSMEKQSLNRCTPRQPRNRKQKNENSEAINSSDMKTQLYLNTSTPCTLRKRKERTENSEEKNSSDMKIQLLNTSTLCTLRKRKERNENSEEINSDKEQELKPSSQCPPRSSKINENVSSNRTVHSQYRIPKRKNYTDNITVTTNVSTQTECSSYSPRSSSSFDIHFQLSGTSLVMTDLLKQLFCLMLKLAAILHRFMITMFIKDNIL